MQVFHCVTTKFYDDGRVTVSIKAHLLESMPEDNNVEKKGVDIYEKWFNNRHDADFVAQHIRRRNQKASTPRINRDEENIQDAVKRWREEPK